MLKLQGIYRVSCTNPLMQRGFVGKKFLCSFGARKVAPTEQVLRGIAIDNPRNKWHTSQVEYVRTRKDGVLVVKTNHSIYWLEEA